MDNATKELFIYLTACAVNNMPPDQEKLAGADLPALLNLAKRHSLTALIAYALKKTGTNNIKWEEAYLKAVRKSMLMDAECGSILCFLEENGIWHMPLKGTVIKELYPGMGLRERVDVDILFDPYFQETVRDSFISQGYEIKSYNKGNHDVYMKKPVSVFEMHTALFGKNHDNIWIDYYTDVKSRLVRDEGKQFAYHFNSEDFYIYMMAHTHKHLQAAGTGLRSLADCYVYTKNKAEVLNWDYIEEELEKLCIDEWEKSFRMLASRVFGNPQNQAALSPNEELQFDRLINSATHGTEKNSIRNKLVALQADTGPIKRTTRWKFLWRLIIPTRDLITDKYPITLRFPWLIPFTWVLRSLTAALFKRKKIISYFGYIMNIKKTD